MKNKIFLVVSLLISCSVSANWHATEKVVKGDVGGRKIDISSWYNYNQIMEIAGFSNRGAGMLINGRLVGYNTREAAKTITQDDFESLLLERNKLLFLSERPTT